MIPRGPILLVEDNPDDVLFMKRAARQAEIAEPLAIVGDGDAAIEYLSGTGDFAERSKYPLPALALLDLKLPFRTGLEVLQWIRESAQFHALPVIMFTTSAERSDVENAYDIGANGYLVKPANMNELIHILKAVKSFWLDHNVLPQISHLRPGPASDLGKMPRLGAWPRPRAGASPM